MEPAATGSSAAVIAVIVVLSILVIARYASDAFHTRAPNTIILRIGMPPAASPAAIPSEPLQRQREVANA
jgi:hypothetical protein